VSNARPRIRIFGSLGRSCELIVAQANLGELLDKACKEMGEPKPVQRLFQPDGQCVDALEDIMQGTRELYTAPALQALPACDALGQGEARRQSAPQQRHEVPDTQYAKWCTGSEGRSCNPHPTRLWLFRSEWSRAHGGDTGKLVLVRGTWNHLMAEITTVMGLSERPRRLYRPGGGVVGAKGLPSLLDAESLFLHSSADSLTEAQRQTLARMCPKKSRVLNVFPSDQAHESTAKRIVMTPYMDYVKLTEVVTKALDLPVAARVLYHADGAEVQSISELTEGITVFANICSSPSAQKRKDNDK